MDSGTNAVSIEIGNTQACPDGYDVLITYSSHRERERIETLIRGTELANAPINWRNIWRRGRSTDGRWPRRSGANGRVVLVRVFPARLAA